MQPLTGNSNKTGVKPQTATSNSEPDRSEGRGFGRYEEDMRKTMRKITRGT